MPTLNQRLASYIADARFEDLPPDVVARAKSLLGYHVGLAFHALRVGDRDALQALAVANTLSEGCGSATIIGTSQRSTLVDAAMATCTLMRAQGLDDVIFPAGIHPGLMVYPVALTIGERMHSSGRDVLTAIVVAYEILGKFGSWTWSLSTPRRATMPFGPFGGVAVASRLLRLSEHETAHALGYAAHTAMGLAEGDAGPVSHYYGLVCRNAVAGAYLAKAGGTSSSTVLEGQYGFLEAFLGTADLDLDAMVHSLGRDFVILESLEKRYPGTALNQVPIELARSLVRDEGLTADAIASIEITLPEDRKNFAAGHSIGPFLNKTNASSSVAFQVAMLFVDGDLNFERYEQFDNSVILDVVRRTRFTFVTGRSIRYARLVVTRHSGERFVREGEHVQFPAEDRTAFIAREAGALFEDVQMRAIGEAFDHFESIDDVASFVELLVPAGLRR